MDKCPVDGAEHKEGARCGHCGWGLAMAVQAGSKVIFFDRCPYHPNSRLVIKETIDWADMARYVCTTQGCLFEIVQAYHG